MESTYREMTVEHLGPDADEGDLEYFRHACELLVQRGLSEQQATAQIWGDGDWYRHATRVIEGD